MQKHIKNLFKDNVFVIAVLITIGITYLSFIKTPKTDLDFINTDKLYHLFAYFILTICWLFTLHKNSFLKYIIVIVCVIYGILIEFLQEILTVYRTSDYKDVLANTIGIILAIIVYNKISKKIDVNSNQDLYKNE